MSAALFLAGPSQWRSMQLSDTLIVPPSNQRANGGVQSRPLLQGLDHRSVCAISPQNASGSSLARFQSDSYSSRLATWACRANSGGGGNTRVSFSTLTIDPPGSADMVAGSGVASWCAE